MWVWSDKACECGVTRHEELGPWHRMGQGMRGRDKA